MVWDSICYHVSAIWWTAYGTWPLISLDRVRAPGLSAESYTHTRHTLSRFWNFLGRLKIDSVSKHWDIICAWTPWVQPKLDRIGLYQNQIHLFHGVIWEMCIVKLLSSEAHSMLMDIFREKIGNKGGINSGNNIWPLILHTYQAKKGLVKKRGGGDYSTRWG